MVHFEFSSVGRDLKNVTVRTVAGQTVITCRKAPGSTVEHALLMLAGLWTLVTGSEVAPSAMVIRAHVCNTGEYIITLTQSSACRVEVEVKETTRVPGGMKLPGRIEFCSKPPAGTVIGVAFKRVIAALRNLDIRPVTTI